jgi:sugar O-acyltransferase (sialic acid O-acetyltransferase NeuD family)
MTDIIIYGAGGLGREIALLIEDINNVEKKWNIIGFADDNTPKGTVINSYTVLGGIYELNAVTSAVSVVIAVGDSSIRSKMYCAIANPGISFPILVHPTVQLGSKQFNLIGRGSVITAGCILTTNIKLGDFTLLNLMTTIGHDVHLGNFVSIMPGCSLSGLINGDNRIFIGTGAKILPNINLGEACIIGAGAVVTKNVRPYDTVVGVPARSTTLSQT